MTPLQQYHRSMTEKALQETIRQAALLQGWLAYHTFNSRRSTPGFPDLVLLRGSRCIVAELKREGKKPTNMQWQWLEAFQHVTKIEAYLWTPSRLDEALTIIGGK